MEESVKKLIDKMIGQAMVEAKKLAERIEKAEQIELPQVLSEGDWVNSVGDEFEVAIVLNQSQTDLGRQMGLTSLEFNTVYDGKLVTDNYITGMFSPFADTVFSPEFRSETERFIGKLTTGDGSVMKTRITKLGIVAIQSFIVPEIVQMNMLPLPVGCTLSVRGMVFEGIDAIMDYWRTQTDTSQPYIIERSSRFPCFDSSDYAYENRFYRNFLICHSKQEADMKAKEMTQLREGGNFCLVNNNLSVDMRPMLYYRDEDTSMTLAF